MNFVVFNGEISSQTLLLSPNNRAFRYGDALFESMRMIHGRIPFLSEHLVRLQKGMKILELLPCDCLQKKNLEALILNLCEKNEIKSSARIRITVFRKEGGLYTPEDNGFDYIIESEKIENDEFELKQKGLIIGISQKYRRNYSPLSEIKSTNALINVLAAKEAEKQKLDDLLLMNDNGAIAEALSSNLFIIKDKQIFTPPLSDGAMDGVMRRQVSRLAKNVGLQLRVQSLYPRDLEEADEIFLTNAVRGIIKVKGYKNKRYFSTLTSKLIRELNNI